MTWKQTHKKHIKTKQTSELIGDTNQDLHLSRLILKTVCVKLYYTKENTLNKIFNLNLWAICFLLWSHIQSATLQNGFRCFREEFVLIGDQEDADGGGLPNQKKKIRVMSELSLQPVFPWGMESLRFKLCNHSVHVWNVVEWLTNWLAEECAVIILSYYLLDKKFLMFYQKPGLYKTSGWLGSVPGHIYGLGTLDPHPCNPVSVAFICLFVFLS